MIVDDEDPFTGVGLALAVYFLLGFGLCFVKSSHRVFECVFTGIFLYPFVLLFLAVVLVLVTSVLSWRRKKIPSRFVAASIMIYGPLMVVAAKFLRDFADGLVGPLAVAAVSCGLGWAYALHGRPSRRRSDRSGE